MHAFVQVLGGLMMLGAAVVAGYGFLSVGAEALYMLAYGPLPAFISGALLFCFGALVEHVAAIRDYQKQQTDILSNLHKSGKV